MSAKKNASTKAPVRARTNGNGISDPLRHEYELQDTLFTAQTALIQRFLEAQASLLASALIERHTQVHFKLPDQVVVETPSVRGLESQVQMLPNNQREQLAGGLLDGLMGTDIRALIRGRLLELESSAERSVAVGAGLLRFAAANHLVSRILPSGRMVTYELLEGEEVPTLPIFAVDELESAITAETDAIAETGSINPDRGELLVPYVPAARRFFLPQWVAFDDEGKLLLNSVQEAEASIASMQEFTAVLHMAVGLAAYFVADEEYQRKRYGILGQLINQGRALARYQTQEIIHTIKQRVAANDLNRGLNVSVPYFDDQELVMKTYRFQVIPAGRIMFVPSFVTRASRDEQARVAQDTRLGISTRKYLLEELELLADAFD